MFSKSVCCFRISFVIKGFLGFLLLFGRNVNEVEFFSSTWAILAIKVCVTSHKLAQIFVQFFLEIYSHFPEFTQIFVKNFSNGRLHKTINKYF